MNRYKEIRFLFMDKSQPVSNISRFPAALHIIPSQIRIFFPRQINERTCLLQIVARLLRYIESNFLFRSLVLSNGTPIRSAVAWINDNRFPRKRKRKRPPHQLPFIKRKLNEQYQNDESEQP